MGACVRACVRVFNRDMVNLNLSFFSDNISLSFPSLHNPLSAAILLYCLSATSLLANLFVLVVWGLLRFLIGNGYR